MFKQSIEDPVAAVSEPELIRLSRVANRLLTDRASFTAGRQRNRTRAGFGTEFLDFREYSSGDDLRHIDWRITARSGLPYIRRYQDELSADWYICLDRSASMTTPYNDKWTLAVQLSAALAYLLLHLGNRVGLIQFSSDIDRVCPLGRGSVQYVNIASQLRTSSPRNSGGSSTLENCSRILRRHQHAIVISDFLKPDGMHPDLRLLRSTGREVQAMQILSLDETRLHGTGMCTLRDAESGQQMAVTLPAGEAAHTHLHHLVKDLEEFNRRSHIRFTSCNTGQTWKDVLVQHLKGMTHA